MKVELSLRAALFAALVAMPLCGGIAANWIAAERNQAAVLDQATLAVRAAAEGLRLRLNGLTQPTSARAGVVESLFEVELLTLDADEQFQRYAFEEMRRLPWLSDFYVARPDGAYFGTKRIGPASVEELNQEQARFLTVSVAERDGALVATRVERDSSYNALGAPQTEPARHDPKLSPWFRAATAGEGVQWTPEYVFFGTNTLGVTAATALRNAEGETLAVIGADISLATIHEFVEQFSERHAVGVALIGVNGRVIAASHRAGQISNDAEAMRDANALAIDAFDRANRRLASLPSRGSVSTFDLTLPSGDAALAAIASPGDRVRWRALAWTEHQPPLAAGYLAAIEPFGWSVVLIALLAAALGFVIWRGVMNPITGVIDAAQAIAAGGPKTDPPAPVAGFREVGALHSAFASMSDALRRRAEESDAIAAELRAESRSRAFAARSLERSRDRMERILQRAPCGIVEWAPDADGAMNIRLWSKRAARMFGRTVEEAQGADLVEIGAVARSAGAEARALARAFARGEGGEVESFWPHVTAEGEQRDMRWRHAPLRAGRDHQTAVLSLIERAPQRGAGAPRDHVGRDHVTGQIGRVGMETALDDAIARGEPCALWMMQLGAVAGFNERHGVEAGDGFLRAAGIRLADAFEDDAEIYRFRGDSFVALTCDARTSRERLEALAERALEAFADPVPALGANPPIEGAARLRIAAARAPEDASSGSELLAAAEAALAETTSRKPIAVFDEAARRAFERRKRLLRDLSTALAAGDLDLAYQPQWRLDDQTMSGVEALIRWPQRADPPPAEFVPLAESAGLIADLGAWALERACVQLAAWRRAGFALDVAVNLSPAQFADPELADRIERALIKSGADPQHIELEITETAIADWREVAVADILARLDGMGLKLALDDFGAGATSLAHLEDLPIATLKFDRRFMAAIGANGRGEALLSGLMRLARELGMASVAEGVETETQLAFLTTAGCDRAQGFHLAPPLGANDAPMARFPAQIDA